MKSKDIIHEIELRRSYEPLNFYDLTGGRLRLMDLDEPEIRPFAYVACEGCRVLVKGAHTCGAVKAAKKKRRRKERPADEHVVQFRAGGAR